MNMMARFTPVSIACIVTLLTMGCGSGSSTDSGSTDMDQLAALVDQRDEAPARGEANEATAVEPAEPAAEETAAEEPQVVTERTPKKGRSFYGQGGYTNAVFGSRFVAANRMVLVQIKKNTDLFEATNGRKPESHEEFMEEIIDNGGVNLPDLEEGYEYWYDVSDHQLKQRRRTGPAPVDE